MAEVFLFNLQLQRMISHPYYAKLLLWGEHIVIHGAQALATPLPAFSGHWVQTAAGDEERLLPFLAYLYREGMEKWLDLRAFEEKVTAGLAFASNIPGGYGLGSSGALCAAIYDACARDKIERGDTSRYLELKSLLGRMESFFHGSSSGIDPLIIYLNRSVLLDAKGVQTLDWQLPGEESAFRFFLLDTGLQRQAGDFIHYFLEQSKQPSFGKVLEKVLLPANESAIEQTLNHSYASLMTVFDEISAFQLNFLPGLIPPGFTAVWKKGLEADLFKLKVCGAGGGGFVLGFTPDFPTTRAYLSDFPLILLG